MKERPIIFSGPMVRAILEGRKTQTRRVIKPQPVLIEYLNDPPVLVWQKSQHKLLDSLHSDWSVYGPYGQPGDRLWVRETHRIVEHDFGDPPTAWMVAYRPGWYEEWKNPPENERQKWADKYGTAATHGGPNDKVRPSIHMPRWASRITLEVTGVRVERVQEISHEDVLAEGVPSPGVVGMNVAMLVTDSDTWEEAEKKLWRAMFHELWDEINGKRGFGWETNPWVWVVEFRRVP